MSPWPLIRAGLPYVLVAAAISVVLYAAYAFGCDVTATDYQARISRIEADRANERAKASAQLADLQGKYRTQEHNHADAMAAVATAHQQDIQNREAISNRTIADLRAGTVRLRSNLAASEFAAAAGSMPTPGTSAGKRDDATGVGLRIADAEFLLRVASEADAVADQLRACQAVVRADRAGQ